MTEIRVPQLSVNDTKVLIVEWVVEEGAFVDAGQEICVVETSKVTQSILAERAGYIRIGARAGDEIDVHSVIGWIGDRLDEPPAEPHEARRSEEPLEITVKAREFAGALGIRLEDLPSKGRILRERDVREYADLLARGAPEGAPARVTVDLPEDVPAHVVGGTKPLSRAQRLVRDNVLKSLVTNAHSYVALDVCFDRVAAVVAELTTRLGQVVRPADAVMFAVARTLADCPSFNGFYWSDHLVTYATVNVGFAVDLDGVLIVPVIRDAHTKPLEEIARESVVLQIKVFRKSLSAAECEGGTFTLTSLGGQGIHTFIPVINGHQAGILAVGATVTRPIMREGQWVESRFATLGLSYDHRLNNGMGAARFLNTVKARLEGLAP